MLCFASILCIASCSASADAYKRVNNAAMVILKKQDNGKAITVRRGDTLQIELERSGGTGYEWYLDESCKEYFDLLKEDKEEISKKGLVGTPVITRWQLKAVKQGDAELKLLLYRNWEGKEKAASSFQVGVKIL
jgi:predicted secreted protein